jgi:hypothetical protein
LDKADEYGYGGINNPLAQAYKLAILPDVVVTSALPQVLWYHRNTRSLYPVCLEVQHLKTLEGQFVDPLLNHTFGASLRGVDMVQDGAKALKSAKPAKRHQLSVWVLAERAATPDAWLKDLDRVEKAALSEGDEQSPALKGRLANSRAMLWAPPRTATVRRGDNSANRASHQRQTGASGWPRSVKAVVVITVGYACDPGAGMPPASRRKPLAELVRWL